MARDSTQACYVSVVFVLAHFHLKIIQQDFVCKYIFKSVFVNNYFIDQIHPNFVVEAGLSWPHQD